MYYTAALLATTCLLNTDLIKGAQTLVFSESVAKTKLRWIQTEFDTNCIELSVVNAWTLRVWLTVTFVHYLSIGTLAADTARGTAWFVTRLISRHHLARFPAHALAENLSRGTLCKKMKIPNLWYFQNSTKFTISVSGMVIYIWRSVTLWSFFRVLNILRNFNRIYWWLCGVLRRVTYCICLWVSNLGCNIQVSRGWSQQSYPGLFYPQCWIWRTSPLLECEVPVSFLH